MKFYSIVLFILLLQPTFQNIDDDTSGTGSGSGLKEERDETVFTDPDINSKEIGGVVIDEAKDTSGQTPHRKSPSIRANSPRRRAELLRNPALLAAIVTAAVSGLVCTILCTAFIVYRMRKKDEGSYVLEEQKYKSHPEVYIPSSKEFFA